MPKQRRFKTNYPGIYYIEGNSPATGKLERIYYMIYRMNGKQIEEKAGRQIEDNMTPAKAARLRTKRIEGDQLSNKEQRSVIKMKKQAHKDIVTLNRLFEIFLENKSHLKSLKADRIRYNLHLKPILGDKEIDKISSFNVDQIRVTLLKNHKPASVKQVLVLLKRIINHGINNGLCQPLKFKIALPIVNNQKTEDLTNEQLTKLLRAIDEEPDIQAANIMRLALYTGMRRSEIFGLQWNDINYEKRFITIRDPKGGTNQTIPLNEKVKKILQNHPKSDSQYVFHGPKGKRLVDYRNPINRIKERAELPKDFRPLHGLRHVYASMLASSGQVDMYTLQKLLTHKSPQMTQRYAHLHDDALKRASNLMGDQVAEAVGNDGNNTERKQVDAS